MTDRIEIVRQRMAETDTDLLVLAPGAHLEWLTGLHPHGDERPCLFFLSSGRAEFVMPDLEAASLRQHTDLPFHCWSDADGPAVALRAALGNSGLASGAMVAIDETMRADHALMVLDGMERPRHSAAAITIGHARMRKDDAEYRALKANAQIADRAMLAAAAELKPGMTELDLARIIRQHFVSEGARPMFNIVGAGGNGAFPHHQTGETVIQNGDVVVVDIGGRQGKYSSDITRMMVVGEKPEDFDRVHAVVEAAVQAAMTAARPGVKAHEVDDAARAVIMDAGYGEFFTHRTGHGLGIEVHEPPYLSGSSQTVLEEGMVFSIEPGIYLPDRFGIRLEDIVILRADGPEILSDLPRDAIAIA